MAELLASGRLVDIIVVLTVIEGAALIAWHLRTGRGPAPSDLMANLLAGIFLLLALRTALTAGTWVWVALALMGALFAHLADLIRRWKSVSTSSYSRLRCRT